MICTGIKLEIQTNLKILEKGNIKVVKMNTVSTSTIEAIISRNEIIEAIEQGILDNPT